MAIEGRLGSAENLSRLYNRLLWIELISGLRHEQSALKHSFPTVQTEDELNPAFFHEWQK